MNLTIHASGSVQLAEGHRPSERSVSVDLAMLPAENGSAQGSIMLTIADTLSSSFSLKLKLTALQTAQLGHQLSDLAQDAQHGAVNDAPRVLLSNPPAL